MYKYVNGIKTKIETAPFDSKGTIVQKNGKQEFISGFQFYIYENLKCPKCNNRMKLSKGRAGKIFLKCMNENCDHIEWLDYRLVNSYIEDNSVT